MRPPAKGDAAPKPSSSLAPSPPARPFALVLASALTMQAALDASGASLHLPPGAGVAAGAALGAVYGAAAALAAATVWAPPPAPLTVVVTGASRGLGKALARELARAGDAVVMVARSAPALAAAAADVRASAGPGAGRVIAVTGAVSGDARAMGRLVESVFGAAGDGGIDLWVNNAAASAGYAPIDSLTPDAVADVISTNLAGALLAARLVAPRLAAQPRGGHVCFVEGAGANGGATPGYAAYGATKAALRQAAKSLAAEAAAARAAGAPAGRVGWHLLSPGMLLTPLLLQGTVERWGAAGGGG